MRLILRCVSLAGRTAQLLMAVPLIVSCATTKPSTPATAAAPRPYDPAAGVGGVSPPLASAIGGAGGAGSVPVASARGEPEENVEPTKAPPVKGESEAPSEKASPTPVEPPAPPPLTAVQVSQRVFAFGASGSWPLSSHGAALVVERNVSATPNPEIFAVFATVDKKSEAEVAKLSEFSRLFNRSLAPISFTLVQFRQQGERLREVKTFSLGNHLVFESLRVVSIRKGAEVPFAVSVIFQAQEGSNYRWVTFSNEGTSQLTLQETLSRSPIIEDIDNDGYLDIIIRERGAEEGTGYETFLTWYKWNGRSFAEYKTTNIVRNLREFLDRAAAHLSEDNAAEFFRSSLPAEALTRLHAEGLSEPAIFDRVFHLAPATLGNPNDPLPNLASITRVTFPNIFENPFTAQDRHGYSFPMTVRFVSSDSTSHFYTAKLYMHRNPFVEPQFTFAVDLPSTRRQ